MWRYHNNRSHKLFAKEVLCEVSDEFSANLIEGYRGLTDKEVCDAIQSSKLPAYLNPSVTDQSFWNPAAGEIANANAFSSRHALYDSVNGEVPDIAIIPGWLRSKARDITEIDSALAVIKESVEHSKSLDREKLDAIEKRAKDIQDVAKANAEAIKNSQASSESE